MNQNEPTTRNITVLNRASLKKYALKVSRERRANKFTRVGEEFMTRCEARVETAIQGIGNVGQENPSPMPESKFVTKLARGKAEEMLELLSRRVVYSEVMQHPSLGCTLK